tara:strand:- start:157 stop:606 length:450 start_codon:yes stop_codon:yes gene_type:complete
MSLKYTTGGRTRNVVNIAKPGFGTAAYTLTDTLAAPTQATDGFRNFNTQKMLHVLVKSTADQTMAITLYVYNSSLGGEWAPLQIPVRAHDGNGIEFMTVTDTLAAGNGTTQYLRFDVPVEGAERIAIQATKGGVISAGNVLVYLGVNSI